MVLNELNEVRDPADKTRHIEMGKYGKMIELAIVSVYQRMFTIPTLPYLNIPL